jgi:UDP-N-acetylmuramoylalanine--D-glutamate ligase
MHPFANKRMTIFGLGRTGQAAARYLHGQGAIILVTESGDTPALQEQATALRGEGIAVELGGHSARVLDSDVIVLSPGVPTNLPILEQARDLGVRISSELEVVWRDRGVPIYAVTGTNGKTTVTALLHHVLTTAGQRSVLCGNNDLPLSEALRTLPKPDCYVLEVSSYQLESTYTFRPQVAAVLNVTPDHPRHGTLQQYAAVKNRILGFQAAGDVSVLNADDPIVSDMAIADGVEVLTFSTKGKPDAAVRVEAGMVTFKGEAILPQADIPLPGKHNLANVLAVVAMACAAGVPAADVAHGIRSFRGVPHRIEPVRTLGGVTYYNDSKSTNIDSLRVALESFTQPVVLIAGGRGKGAGYGTLEALVRKHVRALVLIGEDGPKMAAAWGHAVPSLTATSMEEAVQLAADAADPGDAVLLSPGCASFDWYNNFEERGEDFRACVNALEEATPFTEELLNGA